MMLAKYDFLADENIDPRIVQWLRSEGCDVWDVREQNWTSETDESLLQRAVSANRVILTHDADFGQLVVRDGHPCYGIIELRPGHLAIQTYLQMLNELHHSQSVFLPPFLAVIRYDARNQTLRIRTRTP
jgi:predicted nuclease of predicted toxin-antitoxin system